MIESTIGISIIIPVYNKEDYISDCVESVLKQEFTDYEIILVDDGSTDGSARICDEYSHQYAFIHTFHIKNGGLGPARNYGIANAKGEYMLFLDSDDWIREDALVRLYNAVKENEADAVLFDFMIYDSELEAAFRSKENAQYIGCDVTFEAKMYRCTLPSSCTIMYKTSVWKERGLLFPNTPFEDNALYPAILLVFSNFVVIDEGLYFYRTNYGKTITCNISNDLRRVEPLKYMLEVMHIVCENWRDKYNDLIYCFCYNQLQVSLEAIRYRGNESEYVSCVKVFNKFLKENLGEGKLFLEDNNMEKDVSVIVPVHNSERYLHECLNSVRYQTFKNIEILCIDDNSTDETQKIIESFTSKDNRYRLINDDNGSYGHKINLGIQNAKGKYIAILESDDFYDSEALECLFMAAERNQVDYVDSDFMQFHGVGKKYYYEYTSKYFDSAKYDCVVYGKDNHMSLRSGTSAIWTGLYRKKFIIENNIKLNESQGASFQDVALRFLAGCMAKSSYHLKKALYYYRCDNAGSSVYDNSKIMNIVTEYKYLWNELYIKGLLDEDIKAYYYFWKYTGYFWNAKRLSYEADKIFVPAFLEELSKDKAELRKCWDYFKPYICQRMIEFQNNPYAVLKEEKEREECVRRDTTKKESYAVFAQRGNVIIFGCGNYGRQVLDILTNERDNILCWCDNDCQKWGQYIDGMEVVSPANLKNLSVELNFIIANKYHAEEIKEQLNLIGINDQSISIYQV